MRADESWERWIEGLRAGDDEVVTEFCRRYGADLERVAERHIASGLRRRVGAESVVQSACCSFLRRAGAGQFELADSEALWRLLCAIVLRKVAQQARFHLRRRRGVDREARDGADGVAADAPAPDEALALADELERLLASLGAEERRVVELRLQERTTPEIAAELGSSERTVRRLLARVRERLSRHAADERERVAEDAEDPAR